MNFRSERREEPEINLTPLIDVVFLMLLFFMLTTTFNRETQLAIQLPEADGEASAGPRDPLEVVVDREGNYFINGQQVVRASVEMLSGTLEKLYEGHKGEPFIISADAQAPYQAVVTAMDAAGRAGIANLSLSTKQGPGGDTKP